MTEFLQEWILTLLVVVPLAGAFAVGLIPSQAGGESDARRMRRLALAFSVVTFGLTLVAVVLFLQAADRDGRLLAGRGDCALTKNVSWVSDAEAGDDAAGGGGYIDFRYHVGVDGLSIWLIVLTAGLTPLAIWAGFNGIRHRVREYHVLMLLLEAGMLGVFCARDLLIFYIFFEFTLIPLFFIIGIWGGPRRRQAAARFFVCSIAGSALIFAGVLFLAYQAYALPASQNGIGVFTFDLDTLYELELAPEVQWWLFLAFAAGFAIKVPLFPLHTWLPIAGTEAPTAGSVLLAGVVLKLGAYGLLRFSLPMLPAAAMVFAPIIAALAIVGIIYAALVAWVQDDFKKLIAYSSVSHLGFCVLGMFSLKTPGMTGSVMHMVNHGLSTGALFLIVGMIHERYHTRRFDRIGGLARPMPWMAFFLIVFAFSSIGLPGLNGFVGEFLVLLGTFTSRTDTLASPAGPLGVMHAILAATGIVLSAIYMLHMCQRVLFGPLKQPAGTPDRSDGLTPDLTPREIGILAPIAVACVVLGVWPNSIIDTIRPAADRQVLWRVFDKPIEAPAYPHEFADGSGDSPRQDVQSSSHPPPGMCLTHAGALPGRDRKGAVSPAERDMTARSRSRLAGDLRRGTRVRRVRPNATPMPPTAEVTR